ncbi:alpha-hydroxy-acid oxidizing protein [Undibacterium curvum]|uniref:alpha-hydroxy-acid oxidizing protein n=1 Tax=Undibacterium curvum TaxID=2762294 RepID=UPI003D134E8D
MVDAVGDQTEVWFDGGIRSGLDMLKAKAGGAKGNLVGRAFLYEIGAMSEKGVLRLWKFFRKS